MSPGSGDGSLSRLGVAGTRSIGVATYTFALGEPNISVNLNNSYKILLYINVCHNFRSCIVNERERVNCNILYTSGGGRGDFAISHLIPLSGICDCVTALPGKRSKQEGQGANHIKA